MFLSTNTTILSFFLAHIPSTTQGVLQPFLSVRFLFILQGTESSFMMAERKKNGAQGKYNKEGKRKGAERGNLCPKRFTRKRITGMAEKGDQNKMGM
jgi:hypothetical protein